MELRDIIEAYSNAGPKEQREFRELLEPVAGDKGKRTCAWCE